MGAVGCSHGSQCHAVTFVEKELCGNQCSNMRHGRGCFESVSTARRREEDDVTVAKDKDINEEHLQTFRYSLKCHRYLGATFRTVSTETNGEVLIVLSLKARSVLAFTEDGSPGMRSGHVVWAVCGQHGCADWLVLRLQEAILAGGVIEISTFARPATFEVELHRKDKEEIGIVVAMQTVFPGEEVLAVITVFETGAVPAWNKTNWRNQVVVNDRVTAVGGVTKAVKTMINEMQESWKERHVVTLTIEISKAFQQVEANAVHNQLGDHADED
eukprot:TRINITY_DN6791_c0_g1_i3.p1 TRINITY_DN6791_c0_g1~~TRINITY_DN6791_c0_g1_i3.p1  ORF type:complete len:272 (-),score=37.98 TRINITY_DN6791_c0_g1_i3:202-1017(-)